MSGQTNSKKCRCGLAYDGPSCPLCAPCVANDEKPLAAPKAPTKRKAIPLQYVQKSKVKALVNKQGKRCGDDFLLALDDVVRRKVLNACRVHNGGRKTLEAGCLRVLK